MKAHYYRQRTTAAPTSTVRSYSVQPEGAYNHTHELKQLWIRFTDRVSLAQICSYKDPYQDGTPTLKRKHGKAGARLHAGGLRKSLLGAPCKQLRSYSCITYPVLAAE